MWNQVFAYKKAFKQLQYHFFQKFFHREKLFFHFLLVSAIRQSKLAIITYICSLYLYITCFLSLSPLLEQLQFQDGKVIKSPINRKALILDVFLTQYYASVMFIKDLKIQIRKCISGLLSGLQGVSRHHLHQAETRGTQRSGRKPGRHVLLRASDVGKLEAGCGEERRPWDCLEEHVPPHVSNWKGYGSKATDRNWTLRPMAAEIGGLDFPDGCCGEWGQASWVVVFCGFKVLRHTETPLWSSSTEQLLCG